MKAYLAVFERADDGTWGAYVPDLPGCTSGGATREEVARNVREAIEGHIDVLREFGEPVPEPVSLAEMVEIL